MKGERGGAVMECCPHDREVDSLKPQIDFCGDQDKLIPIAL
jgi:hypothetical protein